MDQLLALIHASAFFEISALLVLAAIVGFIGLLLRQPMVVGFIAVGLLAGPSVLGIVNSPENIDVLAELGIAVLLFLVGLKLDVGLIRTLGAVSLATGLGQVFFTSVFGYLIALALGLDSITSLYVSVALTFSSTIIIVKLLSDKREADSLHGRIAIGFLIVQDIVVVLAMMVLSAFGIGAEAGLQESGAVGQITTILLHGALMLAFVGLFIRYLATPLVGRISRSPELLVVFAISWAALLATLGSHLGFSKELGGLLAGVSLASTPFRESIIARLSSLRDFLLLFFFIALGARLDLGLLGEQIVPALAFSIFVLVGNPLIVMAIMGYMGYRKRTGFLAGLTVAQISEFSLIFMAMGVGLGHIGGESLGLVTLVGLITIALSVYMITYSHWLYRLFEPFLHVFERPSRNREIVEDLRKTENLNYDIILFGIGRYGASIANRLCAKGSRILAVDFNPDEVRRWRESGLDAVYGDACDQEFVASLPLAGVKWVVSAMPHHDTGLMKEDSRLILIDALKAADYQGKIAVSSHRYGEEAELGRRGAALVLQPFRDAAERAVERILEESR